MSRLPRGTPARRVDDLDVSPRLAIVTIFTICCLSGGCGVEQLIEGLQPSRLVVCSDGQPVFLFEKASFSCLTLHERVFCVPKLCVDALLVRIDCRSRSFISDLYLLGELA